MNINVDRKVTVELNAEDIDRLYQEVWFLRTTDQNASLLPVFTTACPTLDRLLDGIS